MISTPGLGRRAVGIATTLLAVLVWADAASAQDQLFVSGRSFAAIGNFGQDLGPAPFIAHEDIFGGGRYAVRRFVDPVSQTSVADGRTGATISIAGETLAVDPSRPRVFVRRRPIGVWMVDVSTAAEVLAWPGNGALVQNCSLAYSVNVLYCGVRRNDDRTDVVAIEVPTLRATTIATVTSLDSFYYSAWRATADGRRLYFSTPGGAAGPFGSPLPVLAMVNTATGVVTTSTAPASSLGGSAVLDEANRRVIALGPDGLITALSNDLAVLGTAFSPASCNNVAVSPHTGRLYLAVFHGDYFGPGSGGPLTLRVFDSASYASVAAPVVPPGRYRNNECRYVTVLTAPGAPRDLAASVSGSNVAVSWTNIGGASGFVLEAGSAPGRTDLSVFLGAEPFASFTGVPSGTYYVRVRGSNEVGGGRTSAETKVVVP